MSCVRARMGSQGSSTASTCGDRLPRSAVLPKDRVSAGSGVLGGGANVPAEARGWMGLRGLPGCRLWVRSAADTCGNGQETVSGWCLNPRSVSPTHAPKQNQEPGVCMGTHICLCRGPGRTIPALQAPRFITVVHIPWAMTKSSSTLHTAGVPEGPALFRPTATATETMSKGPALLFLTYVFESSVISAAMSVLKCYPAMGMSSLDTKGSVA